MTDIKSKMLGSKYVVSIVAEDMYQEFTLKNVYENT